MTQPTSASDYQMRPPPTCEACGRRMWWHGGTEGWACPDKNFDGSCRSVLYRPKLDRPWPPEERYPELET